jgi:hypothetical protein
VKPVGEPDAGDRHVRFDERGWETARCRMAQATAPILDSTYSDLSRCPLSGRYRRQSGHQPAIVGHRDFMRTCPRQPTGPNAALKTRPKPLPGRAPSPADPQPVARAAVFETLAEIPAKVIRVVRLQAPLKTAETKPLPSGHRLDRLFAGWGRDGQKSQAREVYTAPAIES